MTNDQLVDRFAEIGVAQDDAIWNNRTTRFNNLYSEMEEIDRELRSRGMQARLLLCRLFSHPNMQVRLQAATWSLGTAPAQAREVLEAIRALNFLPQALDAGMTLRALDDGTYKPS